MEVNLRGARKDILNLLASGGKWTVEDIQAAIGGDAPAISAQLRNLRKSQYGGHPIRSTPNKLTKPFHYWLETAR